MKHWDILFLSFELVDLSLRLRSRSSREELAMKNVDVGAMKHGLEDKGRAPGAQ